MSVSSNVANALFAPSGKDLKALQSQLDTENPHAEGGFALPGARVKLASAVEQVKKDDRNVIGVIAPRSNGSTIQRFNDSTTTEYVMIGAHYDHLGFGEVGAFERKGEENKIHPGADDNASGTAAVLELAAAFAKDAPSPRPSPPVGERENARRGIIVALWSGEEVGLIGSSYFVEHPLAPLSNIVAYINFDMVGRLHDDKLTLQGIGSSSLWRRLIEKRNVAAGFSLVLQDDPYLPTDVTAFYPHHVPVLSFFTGSHEDYHRPTDTADKINYEGVVRIANFARNLVTDLAQGSERPDYLKVTRSEAPGGRENLRAYLGTIPDYTSDVKGVKLSGVRGGSPAEKAELQGGDVIVEFGGQNIANIYDYTYALDAVKIGQAVTIVVLRNGARVTVKAIPEVRK
jgi:hypothetical protein